MDLSSLWFKANKWRKDKLLVRPEIDYRREVHKTTWTRFPPPLKPLKGAKVVVKSTLGRAYYDGVFPSWVMWDKDRPTVLFLNVDMIMKVFSETMGTNTYDKDWMKVEVLLGAAENMVRREILAKKFPRYVDTSIERHYKTDTYHKSMLPLIKWDNWISKDQKTYLIEFDVGGK